MAQSRLEAIHNHLGATAPAPTISIEESAEVPEIENTPEFPETRTIFPPLELEDHPIDDVRRLRVVVVGAGVSGITAAVLLPAKVPKVDLVIYERNSDVVSAFESPSSNQKSDRLSKREVYGIQTYIPVYDAMCQHMHIKPHLNPPQNGVLPMPQARRSRVIGRKSFQSTN